MNQNMLKQLQQLEKKMAEAQEKLGTEDVEGSAGGGAVKIRMTGHSHVVSVTIKPEVVDADDIEMLQDLVMSAINDASEKVQALTQQKLGGLTAGMKLPGMP